jgi:hypothetical protein
MLHRSKWAVIQSREDGFIGVVETLLIVEMATLVTRTRRLRLAKGSLHCPAYHELGPDRHHNIVMNCAWSVACDLERRQLRDIFFPKGRSTYRIKVREQQRIIACG